MSANFSFTRLLQLIRKQWFENARLYLFSTIALIALLSLIFVLWFYSNGSVFNEESVYIYFLIGLFLSGTIFASISFNLLGDKTKATYWLGFPASQLEKLLCMILYSTIFFVVVYCMCFLLVKTVAVAYLEGLVHQFPGKYQYKLIDRSNQFMDMFRVFLYVFFAVQAFYLMGSVYFPRYSFIITTIIGALCLLAFTFYTGKMGEMILPARYIWQAETVVLVDGSKPLAYKLPPFQEKLLINFLKFSWAPVFWVVAWFRLREKQV